MSPTADQEFVRHSWFAILHVKRMCIVLLVFQCSQILVAVIEVLEPWHVSLVAFYIRER